MENLLEKAVEIRDESNAGLNTAYRIGALFIEIVNKLGISLSAENISVEASTSGVSLVFSADSTDSNAKVTKLALPILSEDKAGMLTPSKMEELQTSLRNLVNTERDARIAAVDNLQILLSAERNDRTAADNNLQTLFNSILSQKGAANGIAPLDETGKISASHLPAYMDDVVEFAGIDNSSELTLQSEGHESYVPTEDEIYFSAHLGKFFFKKQVSYSSESVTCNFENWDTMDTYQRYGVPLKGKVFLSREDGKSYRWSGYSLAVIGSDLALGETDATAFPGNRGVALEKAVVSQSEVVIKRISFDELDSTFIRGFYYVEGSTITRLLLVANQLDSVLQFMITSNGGDDDAFLKYRLYSLQTQLWGEWTKVGSGSGVGNIYNITNAEPIAGFYVLCNSEKPAISAVHVAWNKKMAAAGLIMSFEIASGVWKTYQYIGRSLTEENWMKVENWKDFGSLSAGSELILNINNVCGEPDAGSYYTLETAIAKLLRYQDQSQVEYAKPGLVISYRVGPAELECKQFCGTYDHINGVSADDLTFGSVTLWKDFGGGGKMASLLLGDMEIVPDDDGVVQIPVDNSLNPESPNMLPNRVITNELQKLSGNTLYSVDTVDAGSETTVYLKNQAGENIAEFSVPKGGGGGEAVSRGSISVAASMDKSVLKLGDDLRLTYSYDHLTDEMSDGTAADITITVNIGTATVFQTTIKGVAAGTISSIDLTSYVQAGTVEVRVVPVVTFEDGTQQTKRAYCKAVCKDFNISCDHLLSEGLHNGGYLDGEMIAFNIKITGSGSRTISMYLDGATEPTTMAATGGTVTKTFKIAAAGLAPGSHVVQFVAESEGLLSDSLFFHFRKAGSSIPYIGIAYADKTGRILTGDEILTPQMTAKQYEEMSLALTAWHPDGEPVAVVERIVGVDGVPRQRTLSVRRAHTRYANRFTSQGETSLTFSIGSVSLATMVDVQPSGISLEEYSADMVLKLTATGRSNNETAEERASWSYNDVKTIFSGFDWKTNGWISDADGDALKLTNGAKAVIGLQPYATDVKTSGHTIEVELKVSNISEREGVLLSCIETLENGAERGFKITGQTLAYFTGSSTEEVDTENLDEDGNPLRSIVPVAVQHRFTEDKRMRVAFVIGKSSDPTKRVIEMYVDGARCAAMSYALTDIMKQDTPKYITLQSDTADLCVYSVYVYNDALNDDSLVNNHTVGRPSTEEMFDLFEDNAVLNEAEGVSMKTLIGKGKAVIHIVRTKDGGGSGSGIDDVNACTNKSENFDADHIFFYTPWGWVFRVDHCRMRIQGTSSTKYPVKNYRFYVAKSNDDTDPTIWVNKQDGKGFVPWEGGLTVPISKDDPFPPKVLCAKADFSDSSMSTNTAMAKVFTDVFRVIAPTPPQLLDPNIRMAIDGYPCDIFASTSVDDANPLYVGQYNLNNDKSDWADSTGMKISGAGIDNSLKMSLEFLNNSTKLGNFQVDADIDAQMEAEFDDALEFNYPKDNFWNSADPAKDEVNVDEPRKAAIKRLWSWVKSMVPAGADTKEYKNIASFKNSRFASELPNYFNPANICCWYLLSDYNAMVDQRVKNMIMRTWDGLVWWFTFYDGDCMYGKRNDSKLKYEYNMNRDTWDAEKSKYAFEGHDSVLWCLLLANCEDMLNSYAQQLRLYLTNEKVLSALDAQVSNWCARLYNRSGYYKYMRPELEGTIVNRNGVTALEKAYYMYALNGSAVMHRTHFIQNRFALLDAKYGLEKWTSDQIDAYVSNASGNGFKQTTIAITSADEYYFGWGTNNQKKLQTSPCVLAGEVATLRLSIKLAINDPIRIYGASRIRELDLTNSCSVFAGQVNLSQCKALRVLKAQAIAANGGASSSLSFNLAGCSQLREVNVNGQRQVSTAGSGSGFDLSSQSLLTKFDGGGTLLQSVTFADGAPLTTAILPESLTSLSLKFLSRLTNGGLTLEGTQNIATLIIEECPGLDVAVWMSKCRNTKSVRIVADVLKNDGSDLLDLLNRNVGGIDDSGAAVNKPVVRTRYELTQIYEAETIDAMLDGISDLSIFIVIEAYINLIDELNGEAYTSDAEVEEVTLDNIAEHLHYYNGESYEEYLSEYAKSNMDINELINSTL